VWLAAADRSARVDVPGARSSSLAPGGRACLLVGTVVPGLASPRGCPHWRAWRSWPPPAPSGSGPDRSPPRTTWFLALAGRSRPLDRAGHRLGHLPGQRRALLPRIAILLIALSLLAGLIGLGALVRGDARRGLIALTRSPFASESPLGLLRPRVELPPQPGALGRPSASGSCPTGPFTPCTPGPPTSPSPPSTPSPVTPPKSLAFQDGPDPKSSSCSSRVRPLARRRPPHRPGGTFQTSTLPRVSREPRPLLLAGRRPERRRRDEEDRSAERRPMTTMGVTIAARSVSSINPHRIQVRAIMH